jgi:hypothetical protein
MAWLHGAKLSFDDVVGMDYRQHGANMVQVRPPFSARQVTLDTERVLHHFEIVRTASTAEVLAGRLSELNHVADDVESFYQKIVLQPARLESYVTALNTLDLAPLWWSSVAHPELKKMWTPIKETK